MKPFVLLVFVLAVACVCLMHHGRQDERFQAGPSAAIIGGTVIGDNERMRDFPWYCEVRTRNNGYCGGVLIGPDTVLTANHCLDGKTLDWVRVGNNKYSKLQITQVYSHAKADLAIIRLGTKVSVPPLKIAAGVPTECTQVTIIGQGQHIGGKPLDGKLRKGAMTFVPSKAKLPCLTRIYGSPPLPQLDTYLAYELNLYGQQQQPCRGDSGSAVLIRNELLGIITRGPDACKPLPHGLRITTATSVPSMRPWIDEKMSPQANP